MKEIQNKFFGALEEIQDFRVNVTLCKEKDYKDIKEMLYDITYDTIVDIMLLIDGYKKDDLVLDIVDRKSAESIREGIELHDICSDYLKYSQ